VQQRLRRKEFELRKVAGTENPADLFTKHMDSASKLAGLVTLYGCEFRTGRPEAAPELKRSTKASKQEDACQSVMLQLPHNLSANEIAKKFPAAVAEEEEMVEVDEMPADELKDPTGAWVRKKEAQNRGDETCANVMGEIGSMATDYVAWDTHKNSCDVSAAVGECEAVWPMQPGHGAATRPRGDASDSPVRRGALQRPTPWRVEHDVSNEGDMGATDRERQCEAYDPLRRVGAEHAKARQWCRQRGPTRCSTRWTTSTAPRRSTQVAGTEHTSPFGGKVRCTCHRPEEQSAGRDRRERLTHLHRISADTHAGVDAQSLRVPQALFCTNREEVSA
jgi:hypothetical protein